MEQLIKQFEKTGPNAYASRRKIVDRMIRELSGHAGVEEALFHPAVRDVLDHIDEEVFEALEEHHLVKVTLSELEHTDPKDERFEAKVTVLMENVRHPAGLRAGPYRASFRLSVGREEIVERPGTSAHNPKGLPERTIKEARVFEFGPVPFPAYADATAGCAR